MKSKTLFGVVLPAFVAVSVVFALLKVTPDTATSHVQAAASGEAGNPCPLATNIAAISYVSRSLGQSWKTIVTSLLYTLGRALAYSVLGAMVVASLLSAPGLAVWLQS